MNERPANILIVLLGSIGDVTRALALAVRVKKGFPEAKLTWAVEPKSSGILQRHPAIDEVIVFDRPGGLRAYRSFVRELKLRKFDLLLDLQRHFKSGVTGKLTGCRQRIGFHRRNAKEFNWLFNRRRIEFAPETLSKTLHYQLFGDYLGLPPSEPLDFGFSFSREEIDRAELLIEEARLEAGAPAVARRVALIIGGSWPSKRWPRERFGRTVKLLDERFGAVCYLIGSKGERGFADEIRRTAAPVAVPVLAGKTDLRELAAIMSRMRAAAGADSGPMHIAAAVGTPVVSLWGPTSSKRAGAYGFENLALQSAIGCSPCYNRTCPGLDNLCMSDIPGEAVVARLAPILSA